MRIEQLMTKSPKTCRPNTTLSEASRIMAENGCGCLPVTRGGPFGHLEGVVTDRDICMAARLGRKPLRRIRVADAMTESVWACNPGDDVAEAEAIMQEARVHRLPVVGEYGQVIGLLSLTDLVREAARQQRAKYQQITSGEVVEAMAAICARRAAGETASATPRRRASHEILLNLVRNMLWVGLRGRSNARRAAS